MCLYELHCHNKCRSKETNVSTTTLLINDGFNILAEAKTSEDDGSNATSPPENI